MTPSVAQLPCWQAALRGLHLSCCSGPPVVQFDEIWESQVLHVCRCHRDREADLLQQLQTRSTAAAGRRLRHDARAARPGRPLLARGRAQALSTSSDPARRRRCSMAPRQPRPCS